MVRFFQRILLAVWIIILVTGTLTLFVAAQLPESTRDEQRYDSQLIDLTARDLRNLLTSKADDPLTAIVGHHVLDFGNLMQIFIVAPDGREALGRKLPLPVRRLIRRSTGSPGVNPSLNDPRLRIHQEGLEGYWVVGYQSGFPLGRVLVRPGARLLLLTIGLLVSAMVAFVLTRFIVLPVRRLRAAGQRVAGGDLSVRVAHTVGARTDDIAKLAHDFDTMTERVEQLLHTQQRLMRDVSHELRSPLARLQALHSLARQRTGAIDDELIARMELECERLNKLIEEVLEYARLESRESVDRRPIDLVDLLNTIADDADLEGHVDNKSVTVESPTKCVVLLDNSLIHSALENIVRNGLKYTARGTNVTIALEDLSQEIIIRIEDQGPGVPDEHLSHLFELFYRAEESRQRSSGGSGVGLAIAERSVQLHGGSIVATNRIAGGLLVTVRLPKVSS